MEGDPYPLGATCQDGGVNFALFSEYAKRVELCLYSDDGKHEIQRLVLPAVSNQVWHGFLPGAGEGSVYGYRVYGPYEPHLGHRFNPNKLLIDPYAKCLVGDFVQSELHLGFDAENADVDAQLDSRDNSHLMPKCVVMQPSESAPQPRNRIAKSDTILYEAHVRGLTAQHPEVPERLRGTFSGLANDKVLAHLKALGVTSIELMPVNSFANESFLQEKGLSNYWGYNPLAFFVPHAGYMSSANIYEFRDMVDRIHDAGMEVILDVVFNHTAEGNRFGPTLSFRGIDNFNYYRLHTEDKRFYNNDTGCGNTIDIRHPRVVQLVLDCLRYWVCTMRVDGFRFDLAPVLGREHYGFDQGNGFFDALLQDPALATAKFIAEPWDIGPGGYQLGNFPPGWSEWNDRYRDVVRRFWRGDAGMLPELARRIHGSSDIFEHSGRRPSASVNFITSHDGFTLADLVSYRERHNEANGEENQDGHSENHSDNYGHEGPGANASIAALRSRQQKNLLMTLLFSQGTPMLTSGDEIGRTQQGNNNAYCQDNKISWLDWAPPSDEQRMLLDFTARIIALRKQFPVFNLDRYLHEAVEPTDPTIEWYNAAGNQMQPNHWGEAHLKTLGYLLSWHDEQAQQRRCLYFVFYAGREPIAVRLPRLEFVQRWQILLNTREPDGLPEQIGHQVAEKLHLLACSSVLLIGHADKQGNDLTAQVTQA
jgi:glycogen operon protein